MLEIIRIHNELLGTYGDRGNADVLAYRAKRGGVKSRITDISYNEVLPKSGDIYLLGGAEDAAQALSLEALKRDGSLQKATSKGAVLLAICAGFQIIGESFYSRDEVVSGLGLLGVTTRPGEKRFVGDIAIQTSFVEQPLTGFENHGGATTLNAGVEALGRVIQGHGNGVDGVDGAVSGNIFGSYLHGALLARNPEFADLLISRAIKEPFVAIDPLADQYASWRRGLIK